MVIEALLLVLGLLALAFLIWRRAKPISAAHKAREEREAASRAEHARLREKGLAVLHVFGADLDPEKAWELFAWCLIRGADELTLHAIVMQGGSTKELEAFENLAAADRLADAARPTMNSYTAEKRPLWRLTPATLGALRLAFPRGPFEYFPSDAWYEDPILYRDGEIVLGIITHESEGVLIVSAEERDELDLLGIVYRPDGEWVGY